MDDPANNQATRRPYGLACVTCRRAKIRCFNTGSESVRCDRCVRLGKDCVYESQRRSSRRGDQVDKARLGRDESVRLHSNALSHLGEGRRDLAKSAYIPESASNVLETIASTSKIESAHDSQYVLRAKTEIPAFTPPSFITHSQDTRGLSLDIALNPKRTSEQGSDDETSSLALIGKRESSHDEEDPIGLRLVSLPSARYLFEGFFKHFNDLVGLLDPQLYSFSYTRERSSLLFSIILRIASKVFQPECYPRIRKHTERLLGQALVECDSSVETVWAIVCLYHWKDVNDTRGYTFVGFALRLAASAGWNKMTISKSDRGEAFNFNESEVQVRQRRDKHRIWLALGNLDRTSSIFTDRPLTSTSYSDDIASRSWLAADTWTYRIGDAKAVGGYELTKIAQPVYEMMMATRRDSSLLQSVERLKAFEAELEKLNQRMVEWAEFWSQIFGDIPDSDSTQASLIRLFTNYMRLYFNTVLLHRMLTITGADISSGSIAATFEICYTSALGVLEQVCDVADMEILYFFWDTAHLMTAYAAMVLLKLLKQAQHLPTVSVEEASKVLNNAVNAYSTTARSLGAPETLISEFRSGECSVDSAVAAQTCLLGAILTRFRAEFIAKEDPAGNSTQDWRGSEGPTRTEGMTEDLASSRGHAHESSSSNDTSQSQDASQLTPEILNQIDFTLDYSFMDTRFMNAGLLSWDQPGIFMEPH